MMQGTHATAIPTDNGADAMLAVRWQVVGYLACQRSGNTVSEQTSTAGATSQEAAVSV